MSRKLKARLILSGKLEAQEPLHLGNADSGNTTDMPFAVDGQGRFYLPGTSLGGAIRAFESNAFPESDTPDDRWGYAEGQLGHASLYVVDDAPICGDSSLTELWSGIGIDRRYGGAAEGIKFDRQVLPKGTRFKFKLIRDVKRDENLDVARRDLARTCRALTEQLIPLGGGKSRGFGTVKLIDAKTQEIELTSKSMLAWLTDPKNTPELTTALDDEWVPNCGLAIKVHWRPDGPFMVKAPFDGIAVDMLPFFSEVGRDKTGQVLFAMALPGSGIKGCLRSHAEKIVRTVLSDDCNVNDKNHYIQVKVPLVDQLFGYARQDNNANGGAKPGLMEPKSPKSNVEVRTCYTTTTFTKNEVNQLNSESYWDNQRRNPQAAVFQRAHHVAIDRWTQAPFDHALYDAVEPSLGHVDWAPIDLRFSPRINDESDDYSRAQLALLWLTIRDLAAGKITFGFGSTRGYGHIKVERIELNSIPSTDGTPGGSLTLSVVDGTLQDQALGDLLAQMGAGWKAWIEHKMPPESSEK